MEAGLETATDKAADLTHFIERARQVTRLTELTPEIAHEVIEKIVVFKPEKAGQQVDIYYKTVGLWCVPSPEEMEKLFQSTLQSREKRRRSSRHAVQNQESFSFRVSRRPTLPYEVSALSGSFFLIYMVRSFHDGNMSIILHSKILESIVWMRAVFIPNPQKALLPRRSSLSGTAAPRQRPAPDSFSFVWLPGPNTRPPARSRPARSR